MNDLLVFPRVGGTGPESKVTLSTSILVPGPSIVFSPRGWPRENTADVTRPCFERKRTSLGWLVVQNKRSSKGSRYLYIVVFLCNDKEKGVAGLYIYINIMLLATKQHILGLVAPHPSWSITAERKPTSCLEVNWRIECFQKVSALQGGHPTNQPRKPTILLLESPPDLFDAAQDL